MAILSFLIHLTGATMLLLFGVRMVRTGIERAYGARFRRLVTASRLPMRAAATGFGLAILLQSSAAVALLTAGFAGIGAIGFAASLAVIMGGDLGSALLVQVLSFPLDWLVPLLLAVGGVLFIKIENRTLKQAGRVILGIAFILISLGFLRETMEPIRDSGVLPALSRYLTRDAVAAFLVGAGLSFVMMSSLAVILMCVTLVSVGALPVAAGISLVLGANLGSSLIPLWLSRTMPPAARRIPLAAALVRGSAAILALLAVARLPGLNALLTVEAPGQNLVNIHLAFNALLLLTLPFVGLLEAPMRRLLPDRAPQGDLDPDTRTALSEADLQRPQLAVSALRRETLRMLNLVEAMCGPVMDLFVTPDHERAQAIIARDQYVNIALDGVRSFVARLPLDEMKKEDRKQVRDLTEYAIALESAGDILVKRLVPRALQRARDGVKFSDAGLQELRDMHESVMQNFHIAASVVIADDAEAARLLLEEKTEIARRERSSRKKHLKRISGGVTTSLASSNIHLETLKALKDLNSLIASAAYPILHRQGQLLETRLITAISAETDD